MLAHPVEVAIDALEVGGDLRRIELRPLAQRADEQRDADQVLADAVVQVEAEAAALVLAHRDQALREQPQPLLAPPEALVGFLERFLGGPALGDVAADALDLRDPSVIVLATAKGFQLEDENAAMVRELVNGAPIQIHTFSLGEAESATLKKIAEQTNGTYSEVPYHKLRPASR